MLETPNPPSFLLVIPFFIPYGLPMLTDEQLKQVLGAVTCEHIRRQNEQAKLARGPTKGIGT